MVLEILMFNESLMKKYLFPLMTFFLMSHAMAQEAVGVDSNYVFSGYTERVETFWKMPVRKGAIIFVGNSLTDSGRWNDIAPELPILNRGISGDISFGVVARLDEILRHQPSKIFLMIGVNDLKRRVPISYIVDNYKKIVTAVRSQSPNTKVYLNSILPINEKKLIESFKAVKNEDIAKLNDALKDIAAAHNQVEFIDLYPVVADLKGQLREDITPDGIHLEVWAYPQVVAYLKKIKVL